MMKSHNMCSIQTHNNNNNHHDQDYYAIVADSDNHRILIIDIDNNSIVHSIGSTIGDGQYQFSYPYDIAIDTTNDANILAVSDCNNHSIKYYSLLTYQYVGRVGSGKSGSGLGEFSCPTGIDING